MTAVPDVPTSWLVKLVNEYGTQPRAVAGETQEPYPDLTDSPEFPDVAGMSRTELVGVADCLWPVFAAPTAEQKAEVLSRLLQRSGLAPEVDQQAQIRWVTSRTSPLQTLTAGCAATLLTVVSIGGWRRLGTCDGNDCVDARLHTVGRSRRYCSATCLNRARIRAYRARHREGKD